MAAVLTMPAAVAVAVLKYRLYDIGRVISRTLARLDLEPRVLFRV